MNRFIIVDGLPYLFAEGKAFCVRWNADGFTVGAEFKLKTAPTIVYNEMSVKAKCANNLDSIGAEPKRKAKPEAEEEAAKPKSKAGRKKKETGGETE